jgi:hypothetical protein
MAKTYAWKSGAQIKADPQKAAREIYALHKRNGGVTDQQLIEQAKPATSELHSEFTWNDKVCGVEYRKMQARHILNCLIFLVERENKEPLEVRAFQNIDWKPGRQGVYIAVENILSQADGRAQLLQQFYEDIQDLRQRYRDLQEYTDIFLAMNELELAVSKAKS